MFHEWRGKREPSQESSTAEAQNDGRYGALYRRIEGHPGSEGCGRLRRKEPRVIAAFSGHAKQRVENESPHQKHTEKHAAYRSDDLSSLASDEVRRFEQVQVGAVRTEPDDPYEKGH